MTVARIASAIPVKKRRSADADGTPTPSAKSRCAVEQSVDLLDPNLDRDELGAAFDDKPGAETVSLVHLEGESTQVAESFLTHQEKRLALPLKLSDRRDDVRRSGQAGRFKTPRAACPRRAHQSWRTTSRSSVISRIA